MYRNADEVKVYNQRETYRVGVTVPSKRALCDGSESPPTGDPSIPAPVRVA
jgi:hypothetical protein